MPGKARGKALLQRRIVAAIVAAVAAAEGVAPEEVRLRSVTPAAPGGWPPLWSLAGRQDQMARRAAALWGKGRRS
ncbi:MAG: hypothetical protein IMW98_00830 [Firmicutes bacterium]|nr:hypothetical protein [Bacillota bacterium]